jgi:hypothetical protein
MDNIPFNNFNTIGCSVYDQSVPGTGPPRFAVAAPQSIDYTTYNNSFNLSLKSKSDLNLNPAPEGNIKTAFPRFQKTREGIYAVETDRGELSPTIETQMNVKTFRNFENRLQDPVRPTTKETTLYTYDGSIAPKIQATTDYSNFIPYYAPINGKTVRVNGASNYGLRSATNYSYFAGAAPTGVNQSALQNPDVRVDNLWQRPDFNVDGPGTFKGVIPNGERFQQYRRITDPTTSGLKLNYNLETDGGSIHDYSDLLGKQVNGIENRYTASYQIAPLLTNPLHVIWDPTGAGEIPAFNTNQSPPDYSFMNLTHLPSNEYNQGGYNEVWEPNKSKESTNSYILGMDNGIYNPMINWKQGRNDKFGLINTESNKVQPGVSYSSNRSLNDLFQGDQEAINKAYPFVNQRYTTLGDPTAGQITVR